MDRDQPHTPADAEVVRRVLNGDGDAFAILLKRYRETVLRIVSKHVPPEEIEEVAQEVFIRAFRSLTGFREAEHFKGWIAAIAVRSCHDFWRQRYRSREMVLSDLSERQQAWLEQTSAADSEDSFEAVARRREAREVLDWALDRLSPDDRMVLELVHLEGIAVKEVAERLGWSAANVKVRAFRSRRKLHKLLAKREGVS